MKFFTFLSMAALVAFSVATVNAQQADEATRAQNIEYILTPSAGATVDEISQVSISFAAGQNVGFYDVYPAAAALECVETGDVYYGSPMFAGRDEDGRMSYDIEFTELGGSETVTLNLPGTYELTIRGAYTTTIDEDGEESEPEDLPVITTTYKIAYPVDFTLNPEAGSNVDSLSEITLSFGAGVNVGFYEGREGIVVLENLETGEFLYATPMFVGRSENGEMTYKLEFNELGSTETEEVTLPGNYQLVIRGLYTTTIDEDGNESEPVDLPAIYANYTIVYPIDYVLNPDNGAIVESIETITVTFAAGANVGIYDGRETNAVLENIATGDTYYGEVSFKGRGEDGEMTYEVEFSEIGEEGTTAITTPGNYRFTLRGLYTSTIDEDGEESEPEDLPVINALYTIEYPVNYYLNPADGADLEEINTITITFAPGVNVGFYEGRNNTVVLENLDTEDVYYATPFFEGRGEDGEMTYSLEFFELGASEAATITDKGTYLLTIRGFYTTTIDEDGEESEPVDLPAINATYTIGNTSAVETITRTLDETSFTVYSISGVRVLNQGNESAVRNLPSGLYIINGKKVYIRK